MDKPPGVVQILCTAVGIDPHSSPQNTVSVIQGVPYGSPEEVLKQYL